MYQTVFSKIKIAALFVWLVACQSTQTSVPLPYYNTPDFTPIFTNSEKEISKQVTHTIDAFSLTNQSGNTITDKDINGKIHVANFIFTKCGSICPVMIKHMKMVQEKFSDRKDIVLLSYSVTPWIDSVARLKDFAASNNITSSNWHLLTGNRGEIYKLARQSYFAEEDLGFTKDSTEFLHTEHVLLIDKTKRIRGIYNGTLALEIEQMIADIATLAKE
jgi:protein SCO1